MEVLYYPMKKNMTSCLDELSGGSASSVESIVSTKYRKFSYLYWALKPVHDNIISLSYDESTDDNILKVDIEISNKTKNKVFKAISEGLTNVNHEISSDDNTLTVEIIMDESNLE